MFKIFTTFAIVALILALTFTAFLLIQARASLKHTPPELVNGSLPDCPSKPNCVASNVNKSDPHYIEPIVAGNHGMNTLQAAVVADGGTVVSANNNLLVATYQSNWLGFIDDLLLLKSGEEIQVRSSSRVGYSDLNANRKRVERLRKALKK